jgi:hypothetical protein
MKESKLDCLGSQTSDALQIIRSLFMISVAESISHHNLLCDMNLLAEFEIDVGQ